jgi:hypothetical protein
MTISTTEISPSISPVTSEIPVYLSLNSQKPRELSESQKIQFSEIVIFSSLITGVYRIR